MKMKSMMMMMFLNFRKFKIIFIIYMTYQKKKIRKSKKKNTKQKRKSKIKCLQKRKQKGGIDDFIEMNIKDCKQNWNFPKDIRFYYNYQTNIEQKNTIYAIYKDEYTNKEIKIEFDYSKIIGKGGFGLIYLYKEKVPIDSQNIKYIVVKIMHREVTEENEENEELKIIEILKNDTYSFKIQIDQVNFEILPDKKNTEEKLSYEKSIIVMKYYNGTFQDILDFFKTNKDTDYYIPIYISIFKSIINQIDYYWTKYNLIYTDLKPSNIFFECIGNNKLKFLLGDFGSFCTVQNQKNKKCISSLLDPVRIQYKIENNKKIINTDYDKEQDDIDVLWYIGYFLFLLFPEDPPCLSYYDKTGDIYDEKDYYNELKEYFIEFKQKYKNVSPKFIQLWKNLLYPTRDKRKIKCKSLSNIVQEFNNILG